VTSDTSLPGRFARLAAGRSENNLIRKLRPPDRERLLAQCDSVQLVLSDIVCEAGELTRHVLFPVDGFVSLVTEMAGHSGVEVGMVGREGLFGVNVALGVPTSSLRAVVQGPGAAWQLGRASFLREVTRNALLGKLLKRYQYVLMTQLATAAACQRFHPIGARLARWLLMSSDRAHADSFRVTHEFLALMLGVRRVGITVAAGSLHAHGLIRYHRGEVCVLDREGLEKQACSCYAADRAVYQAQIGA